jgi:S1-C subfamily serine protease
MGKHTGVVDNYLRRILMTQDQQWQPGTGGHWMSTPPPPPPPSGPDAETTAPAPNVPSVEPTLQLPTSPNTLSTSFPAANAQTPQPVNPAQAFPPASHYWATGQGLGAQPQQPAAYAAQPESSPQQTTPPGAGQPTSAQPTPAGYPGTAAQPAAGAQPHYAATAYAAQQPTGYPGQYQFTTQPGPYQDPNAYGSYLRWPPPQTTAVQAAPAKRHPGRTVLALFMAFMLGIGTFAVGGRVISSFTQEPTSVTTPVQDQQEQPTIQQPSGTQQEDGSEQQPWWSDEDQGQDQQTQPTYPSSADASVTADQSKGIVLINAIAGSSQSAGTGMVLSSDGKVLTNYHVVAGTEQVTVVVVDTNTSYDAKVLGFDATNDVALLQLQNASGLQTITIDNDSVSAGDTVSVVGNANGNSVLIRADGQVTATDQSLTVSSDSPWGAEENLEGLIEANANAVPGDSGGPMFDSEAEVLGITTAGSERESITYAIPIAKALNIVSVIEAGQDSGTVRVGPAGFLGISVSAARGHRTGRMIETVSEGGPADLAGITAGSTLISVGDEEIRGDTNVANVVRALEPGTQVEVTWYDPYGDLKSATVTLGESTVN